MKHLPLNVLKDRIVERYDPDELVDLLGIDSLDLLDAFEDKLLERIHMFIDVEDINDE